ncbi:ABC transporter permease [Labrys okinawensis]|uniref:ABC transporter permease n=1 Tax=Labrys okinawensis TaxID=346911 RepID=UPI0039BD0E85
MKTALSALRTVTAGGWWLSGLARTRPWRMAGTVCGVAITIALLALLLAFLRNSEAAMTARSIAAVPVDWQIELAPAVQMETAQAALGDAVSVRRHENVGYASVDGFEASTADTVQTTGAGQVLGLSQTYAETFPGQIRLLQGALGGALVTQQMASNLHVGVGDKVIVHLPDTSSQTVTVAGVVDLPNADAMFQAIGLPAAAAPQAPPDNVLILPLDLWQGYFAKQAVDRPRSVRWQIHATLDHAALPTDPLAAYRSVSAAGHNLELLLAGQGLLANNLAARLDAARADSLYARVLFLFLGTPGLVLAGLLTVATVASGERARQRDQTLLRQRGISQSTILALALGEAMVIWLAAMPLAACLLVLIGPMVLGMTLERDVLGMMALGAVGGLVLALGSILLPAWHRMRRMSVIAGRMSIGPRETSLWRRIHLDFILLGLAGLVYWRTAESGYQIVLATEGVAETSVDYWSFLAPLLLWIGIGLITLRCVTALVQRGRWLLAYLVFPLAGALSEIVAASFSRQQGRLAIGVGLTALAFTFAVSTAIFNTTYQGQALVDAQLTNGADVTVQGEAGRPAGAQIAKLASLPEVAAVEPMQHRYAYVGTDLQDLYGIDPRRIGQATSISDAFFASHDARGTLEALAGVQDGVLVSEETVSDFQLRPGDRLNLRVKHAGTQAFVSVPFTFVGVVREFPTAPRDSFLVANAGYVARMTGMEDAEILLARAATSPQSLHRAISAALVGRPDLRVSDVGEASHLIGSSLTAVDLSGLTRLELGFAVIAIAAAAGLVLALGLADRRRSFAILALLGASPRQIAAFLWLEGGLVFTLGALIGLVAGGLIAWMLVTVLQGAFDPPPETLAVPWSYLVVTVCTALLSSIVAIEVARRDAQTSPLETIREMR